MILIFNDNCLHLLVKNCRNYFIPFGYVCHSMTEPRQYNSPCSCRLRRLLELRVRIPQGYGFISLVSVVFCQAEASASD